MAPTFNLLEMCSDPINEVEKQTAYELFRRKHEVRMSTKSQVGQSCLREVRKALHLTIEQAAERMQVSESSYQSHETSEAGRTISLKNLQKCAEIFDCELVYELRTKDGHSLDERIWNEAFEATKNHGYLFKCMASRRAYALNDLIVKKLNDPEFRRKMKWSKQTRRFRPLYE